MGRRISKLSDLPRWRLYSSALFIGSAIAFGVPTSRTLVAARQKKEFATDGLFAYCRHPMYATQLPLGITSILMTIDQIPNRMLPIVCLLTTMFLMLQVNELMLDSEEALLREEFGQRWDVYCANTPRWPFMQPDGDPALSLDPRKRMGALAKELNAWKAGYRDQHGRDATKVDVMADVRMAALHAEYTQLRRQEQGGEGPRVPVGAASA